MSVCKVYHAYDTAIPLHAVRRQHIGRFIKGGLLHRKMPPFGLQKTAFQSLKHGILQRPECQTVMKGDRNAAVKDLFGAVSRAAVPEA